MIGGKNTKKGGKVEVLATTDESYENTNQDPAGSHTNYHSQFKYDQNRDINEVIPEVSEREERDRTTIYND